jgi:hypothetical protein
MRTRPYFSQRKNGNTQRNHHPKRPDFVYKFVHAADSAIAERVDSSDEPRVIHVRISQVGSANGIDEILSLFQVKNFRPENPGGIGVKFHRSFKGG